LERVHATDLWDEGDAKGDAEVTTAEDAIRHLNENCRDAGPLFQGSRIDIPIGTAMAGDAQRRMKRVVLRYDQQAP
jgi:hypothetical protein